MNVRKILKAKPDIDRAFRRLFDGQMLFNKMQHYRESCVSCMMTTQCLFRHSKLCSYFECRTQLTSTEATECFVRCSSCRQAVCNVSFDFKLYYDCNMIMSMGDRRAFVCLCVYVSVCTPKSKSGRSRHHLPVELRKHHHLEVFLIF